jgi:membrane fusion protein, multidrug efflux system
VADVRDTDHVSARKTGVVEMPVQADEEKSHRWPEDDAESSRKEKARSYFREHPAVTWGLVIFAIVAALGAFLLWRHYSVRESTDDAQIDGHVTPISARVSGTVTAIHVEDNQYVNAGTVLFELDPADYQVAVLRAEAEVADAEAAAQGARSSVPITSTNTRSALANARAAEVAANREVQAARARLSEAQANYTRVSKDLERMRTLVAKDEISRQQYDAAVAGEQASRATVEAAQAAVASAESHVLQAQAQTQSAGTAPQQVQVTQSRAGSAQAALQRAQAALRQARLNLQYTKIVAPAAGIISKRTAEVGQVIQPGQPMASLINLEDVWVTANFKETQLQKMKPGQKVTIHVDAFDRDYQGHVDSFGGATGARFSLLPPENATGNYVKVVQRVPVKIVIDRGQDPNHELRPGMSVVPTVLTK